MRPSLRQDELDEEFEALMGEDMAEEMTQFEDEEVDLPSVPSGPVTGMPSPHFPEWNFLRAAECCLRVPSRIRQNKCCFTENGVDILFPYGLSRHYCGADGGCASEWCH